MIFQGKQVVQNKCQWRNKSVKTYLFLFVLFPSLSFGGEHEIQYVDGFSLPESVIHDEKNDVYLVSNINGKIHAKDDNGYISKVSPDGKVLNLKWIDGESDQIELHSPKAIKLFENYLYVADIDTVRVFDVNTQKQVKNYVLKNATFLNDIEINEQGDIFVSDSSLVYTEKGFKPALNDAIYKISQGKVSLWSKGQQLGQPNGLELLDHNRVATVTRGSNQLLVLNSSGDLQLSLYFPGGILDGLVKRDNEHFLVSSWKTSTIYQTNLQGEVLPLMKLSVPAANIGFDKTRQRILLPLLKENRIGFVALKNK